MPGGTVLGTGRRLEVAGHLTVMEVFERYRGAEDAAAKAHLQVICLKAQGWRTREVARSTGSNQNGSAANASLQRRGRPARDVAEDPESRLLATRVKEGNDVVLLSVWGALHSSGPKL